MQLFIVSQLEKKWKQIFLKNVPELLAQLRKVLRAKIGDIISVQTQEGEITRYTIQITDRTDKDLAGEIVDTTPLTLTKSPLPPFPAVLTGRSTKGGSEREVTMLIAMPNKREKAELIVQKLSEIGVSEIVFRPAERSVLRAESRKNKAERLYKIAREATEQSWGVRVPRIVWCDDVRKVCEGKEVIVFDATPLLKGGKERSDGGFECPPYEGGIKGGSKQNACNRTSPLDPIPSDTPPVRQDETKSKGGKLGVIWPEGGLTVKDYQLFEPYEVVGLGETILRMETAAIIGGRKLKNL